MNQPLQQIVILGGGSAGWLTAGLLATRPGVRAGDGLRITLIESPDTPAIGVGEGTWPSMRDSLRRMALSETALVRRCEAAFKQGSRFIGWAQGGGEHYHHPFSLPQGYPDSRLAGAWLGLPPDLPFAEAVCAQVRASGQGKAPKQAATPEYAAVANYGYHFDAGLFGQLLREHCVDKLGVRHLLDHVEGVDSHENGDIAALRTRAHGAVAGDLFVDCSGLPALLLGGHYGVPLVSQREVLFNDSALALQVPYAQPDARIATQTLATAQPNGWIWDIGLPTRRGVGHVYSSAHSSHDAAEQQLRAHIRRSGGPADPPAARRISFQPGYRERFWQNNCVAIGLSSGFIEPLEASALALVELAATRLSEELPLSRADMDIVARRFNEAFSYRWQRVIEFLKLHYVLSQRGDSDYWREHREARSVPERLQELLRLWQLRPPSRHDFAQAEEVFPSASYQYVLYGMGFRPSMNRPCAPSLATLRQLQEVDQLSAKLMAHLPAHRELINHIHQHGFSPL